jgi:hypothetical protein
VWPVAERCIAGWILQEDRVLVDLCSRFAAVDRCGDGLERTHWLEPAFW